jgi:DNA-binding CsgD family transcriptional regulator
VEWLIATTTHLAAQPDTVVPYLWLIHGQALAASGQFEEAERRLSAAQAAARASGYRGLLWRIQAELASVVYQLGQPRRAAEEVASGQELINALAAELREHQSTSAFAQQFLERSSALLPDRDSMQQRLLTAREVEVAALVAEGKTNREIANALVLSERTVERHVANIMLKLDVHTRAQIAVWVVQHL